MRTHYHTTMTAFFRTRRETAPPWPCLPLEILSLIAATRIWVSVTI